MLLRVRLARRSLSSLSDTTDTSVDCVGSTNSLLLTVAVPAAAVDFTLNPIQDNEPNGFFVIMISPSDDEVVRFIKEFNEENAPTIGNDDEDDANDVGLRIINATSFTSSNNLLVIS
eukprot:CAMPEP_0174993034 /NCGR_PEP_ID=MMETSP0004_2-20121128/22850_1 /TAXON_ID=420556 /ORGANISM="Ochromonas sp., Strain CCMP1393" /LENGTH=116 /DNA_ID=CAMNT_0016247103 /DNA_START=555 /DNA_END=905 /DNA_ORIENTATION=+